MDPGPCFSTRNDIYIYKGNVKGKKKRTRDKGRKVCFKVFKNTKYPRRRRILRQKSRIRRERERIREGGRW